MGPRTTIIMASVLAVAIGLAATVAVINRGAIVLALVNSKAATALLEVALENTVYAQDIIQRDFRRAVLTPIREKRTPTPPHSQLDELTSGLLSTVVSLDEASAIIQNATLVFNYFVEENVGPRYPPPESLQRFFSDNVGQCGVAASTFIKMLAPDLAKQFQDVNIIADDPAGPLHGHTIAGIRTSRGSLLVDLTFGLVLVTAEPRFSPGTFERNNYRMAAIGVQPADHGISREQGIRDYWSSMDRPRSWIAYGREPLVARSSPIRLVDSLLGERDNDADSLQRVVRSSYHRYAGSRYGQSITAWRFVNETGDDAGIEFLLTDQRPSEPPSLMIRVVDEDGFLVASEQITADGGSFSVRLPGRVREPTVQIYEASYKDRWREVDAVSIKLIKATSSAE
jgi:hypothetical protein